MSFFFLFFLKKYNYLIFSFYGAKNGSQDNIFDKAEQVLLGGPFIANGVKGESLKADKFCRGSPRDPQIFLTDFASVGFHKYLPTEV